ncbi:MAG: DUF2335 domain-containing protein [Saprospiraceae bacterium]|nr:DUF2335 domain-containing protein [Saprospiraceae bacterium]MBP9211103.1 DUF2335 domain-containing protein [Saprospiraceae bacterium]
MSKELPSQKINLPAILETLPKEIQASIKKFPKEQQEKVILTIYRQISIQQTYVGPIPSPEMLSGYEEIVEGSAKLIIDKFDKQFAHRVEMEKTVIPNQVSQTTRGQWFGFIIAMTAIGWTVYLSITGHEDVAKVLGGTTMVSLVSVFVIGRFFSKK